MNATETPDFKNLFGHGKNQRKYVGNISPVAWELADLLIAHAIKVEDSQGVFWFYVDDGNCVAFEIRQSDSILSLALTQIGAPLVYWQRQYYKLGKTITKEIVEAVQSKIQAPVAETAPQDEPEAPQVEAVYDNLVMCALCGKKHKETSNSYRMIYLKRDKTLESGYYMPRLTEVEKYALSNGEFNICTGRADCQERRIKQDRERHDKLMFDLSDANRNKNRITELEAEVARLKAQMENDAAYMTSIEAQNDNLDSQLDAWYELAQELCHFAPTAAHVTTKKIDILRNWLDILQAQSTPAQEAPTPKTHIRKTLR